MMSLLVNSYRQEYSVCDSHDEFNSWLLTYPDLLEEQRTRFRAEICQFLVLGNKRACTICGWAKKSSDSYGLLLIEYQPLKILEIPLSKIIAKTEQVSTEDMSRTYCVRYSYHESPPHSETLLGKLSTIKQNTGISIGYVLSLEAAAAQK